eukprot:jgi/Ulvmu1/1284/UM011_0008.1
MDGEDGSSADGSDIDDMSLTIDPSTNEPSTDWNARHQANREHHVRGQASPEHSGPLGLHDCMLSPSTDAVHYHDVAGLSPAVRRAALQAAASVEDGLTDLLAGHAPDDIMARAWAAGGADRRSAAAGRRRSTHAGRASTRPSAAEAATALLLTNLESLFGIGGGAAQQIVAELQGGGVGAPVDDVAVGVSPAEEVLEVVHVSTGSGETEPVVVLSGAQLQQRLPAVGLPLPAALLHPRLRDFLAMFSATFDARLAELRLEATPAAEGLVALSLADLFGTGVFSSDEDGVRESLMRCGDRYRDHLQEVLAALDGDLQLRDSVWWLVPRVVELDHAALAADERAQRMADALAAVRARGRWRRAADRNATVLSLRDFEMFLIGQSGLSMQIDTLMSVADLVSGRSLAAVPSLHAYAERRADLQAWSPQRGPAGTGSPPPLTPKPLSSQHAAPSGCSRSAVTSSQQSFLSHPQGATQQLSMLAAEQSMHSTEHAACHAVWTDVDDAAEAGSVVEAGGIVSPQNLQQRLGEAAALAATGGEGGAGVALLGRRRGRYTRFAKVDAASCSDESCGPSRDGSSIEEPQGGAQQRQRLRATTSFTAAAVRADSAGRLGSEASGTRIGAAPASGGGGGGQQVLVSGTDRFHPMHWAPHSSAAAVDTKVALVHNTETGQHRLLAEHMGQRYNLDAAWLVAAPSHRRDTTHPGAEGNTEGLQGGSAPPAGRDTSPLLPDLWSAAEARGVPPALAAPARSMLCEVEGVVERSRGVCAEVERSEGGCWRLACLNGPSLRLHVPGPVAPQKCSAPSHDAPQHEGLPYSCQPNRCVLVRDPLGVPVAATFADGSITPVAAFGSTAALVMRAPSAADSSGPAAEATWSLAAAAACLLPCGRLLPVDACQRQQLAARHSCASSCDGQPLGQPLPDPAASALPALRPACARVIHHQGSPISAAVLDTGYRVSVDRGIPEHSARLVLDGRGCPCMVVLGPDVFLPLPPSWDPSAGPVKVEGYTVSAAATPPGSVSGAGKHLAGTRSSAAVDAVDVTDGGGCTLRALARGHSCCVLRGPAAVFATHWQAAAHGCCCRTAGAGVNAAEGSLGGVGVVGLAEEALADALLTQDGVLLPVVPPHTDASCRVALSMAGDPVAVVTPGHALVPLGPPLAVHDASQLVARDASPRPSTWPSTRGAAVQDNGAGGEDRGTRVAMASQDSGSAGGSVDSGAAEPDCPVAQASTQHEVAAGRADSAMATGPSGAGNADTDGCTAAPQVAALAGGGGHQDGVVAARLLTNTLGDQMVLLPDGSLCAVCDLEVDEAWAVVDSRGTPVKAVLPGGALADIASGAADLVPTPGGSIAVGSIPDGMLHVCLPDGQTITLDPASDDVAVLCNRSGVPSDIVIAVTSCAADPNPAHAPDVSAMLTLGAGNVLEAATVTATLPAAAVPGAAVGALGAVPSGGLSMLAPPDTFLGLASPEERGAAAGTSGGEEHAVRAVPCNAEQTAALQGTVRYVRDGQGNVTGLDISDYSTAATPDWWQPVMFAGPAVPGVTLNRTPDGGVRSVTFTPDAAALAKAAMLRRPHSHLPQQLLLAAGAAGHGGAEQAVQVPAQNDVLPAVAVAREPDTGEALALVIKVRHPPATSQPLQHSTSASGTATTFTAACPQPALAAAARILCQPGRATPPTPPGAAHMHTAPHTACADVTAAGVPTAPGPFSCAARWPLHISRMDTGRLSVLRLDWCSQLPQPLWTHTVTGRCLHDVHPAYSGAALKLHRARKHQLVAEVHMPDERRAVCAAGVKEVPSGGHDGGGRASGAHGAERSDPRMHMKAAAVPAVLLHRLWRSCHEALVAKAVAAAQSSGKLHGRGARQRGHRDPAATGVADEVKTAQQAAQQAAACTAGGAAGESQSRKQVMHESVPQRAQHVPAAPHGGMVAGPMYPRLVDRADHATMRQHMRTSAAAFRADVAAHVAAGTSTRRRPGLLLRDVLQAPRGPGCAAVRSSRAAALAGGALPVLPVLASLQARPGARQPFPRRQGLGGGFYMEKRSPQNPITRRSPSPEQGGCCGADACCDREGKRRRPRRRAVSGSGIVGTLSRWGSLPVCESHSESVMRRC